MTDNPAAGTPVSGAAIASRLASALGRRDEGPNVALAVSITSSGDVASIVGLVDLLQTGSKAMQNDAIKVLCEIGARNPNLIAGHGEAFIGRFASGNNRMIWGAMTALHEISRVDPAFVFQHLDAICRAADRGSVIARDQLVNILIMLATHDRYVDRALPELLRLLETCALNQLPMYAERAAPVMPPPHQEPFRKCLRGRLEEDMKPSKRKRVQAVLGKL